MGLNCLNLLDKPVSMAVPKPMLTEFGIHYTLESCEMITKAVALLPVIAVLNA